MPKHIKFPSIEQYRHTIAQVERMYNFVGLNDQGEPIYDQTKLKPVIKFKGSVKLHGTNAAVCFNDIDELYVQSRENVITPEKDNAGFAKFVREREDDFLAMFDKIVGRESIDLTKNTLVIFGEWAGGNIQPGEIGVGKLEKSFYIFGLFVSPNEDTRSEFDILHNRILAKDWLDYSYLRNGAARIFNLQDYASYEIDIDFNNPQLVQNALSALTIAVEEECPIAKAFGIAGVGEGIVWTGECNGYRLQFKVKGEKHSSSKVTTLAAVDVEKLNGIIAFIDNVCTESRFNQAIEKVFEGGEPTIQKTGEVIKWFVGDVMKEETDTMKANNIDPKEIGSQLSKRVKEMFIKHLNS